MGRRCQGILRMKNHDQRANSGRPAPASPSPGLGFSTFIRTPRPILCALALLLGLGNGCGAEGANPDFDSTGAYRQIVRRKSAAEVVEAIERLSEHYQKNLTAGKIYPESDRDLILEAIPVIIDHMDDRDVELAIKVFYVLASIQVDCPAPKKAAWVDWWKRKQNGERIAWAIEFDAGTQEKNGSNKAAPGQPVPRRSP